MALLFFANKDHVTPPLNSSKKDYPFIFLLIGILLPSCNPSPPERPLVELSKQYSPDSTYVVYSYYEESAMVFGSAKSELKLAFRDEEFDRSLPELNGFQLVHWNGDTSLTLAKHFLYSDGQTTNQEKTTHKIIQGLNVVTVTHTKGRGWLYETELGSVKQFKITFVFNAIL